MFGLILAGIVAVLHVGFMVLEMRIYPTPRGQKIFKMSAAHAEATRVIVANQGLYNGILAGAMILAIVTQDRGMTAYLMLGAVIAGAYGAKTFSKTILYVQALPAALALCVLSFGF